LLSILFINNQHFTLKIFNLLFCSFLFCQTAFAQNASDQFLLYDIQNTIVPADYPYYYLMQKYSGHTDWVLHIENKNMLRQLQRQIDNTLLIISPNDNLNAKNAGNWDAEILDKPKCISDSAKNKILKDEIKISYKWWYNAKKIKAEKQKEAKRLQIIRDKKPVYDKQVYTIHEPWILKKGLICLVYVTIENDNGSKAEKIYVYERVEEAWVFKNIIQ
jgi:hypothetical protein